MTQSKKSRAEFAVKCDEAFRERAEQKYEKQEQLALDPGTARKVRRWPRPDDRDVGTVRKHARGAGPALE